MPEMSSGVPKRRSVYSRTARWRCSETSDGPSAISHCSWGIVPSEMQLTVMPLRPTSAAAARQNAAAPPLAAPYAVIPACGLRAASETMVITRPHWGSAVVVDQLDGVVDPVPVEVIYTYLGAGFGESARQRPADMAARSGDDGTTAAEVEREGHRRPGGGSFE